MRYLENCEAFAVRQIWWTASLFQQEHYLPTKTQLLKRSRAEYKGSSPLVQQTLDAALRMLSGESKEAIGAVRSEISAKHLLDQIGLPVYAEHSRQDVYEEAILGIRR